MSVIVNLFTRPPAAPVPGLVTGSAAAAPLLNGAGSGGGVVLPPSGVPPGGTPAPAATPVVFALPATTDPLSFIGSMVIFAGIPYVFTADPSGGPTGYWAIATVSSQTIADTHANRATYLATNYPVGALYYETDTAVSYVVQNPASGKCWMFFNGVQTGVLASLPTLGILDVNYTFQASDYKQSWIWNGTAWNFALGMGSGYFVTVAFVGFLPYGTWGLCDGSTYDVSQNDATTTPVITPVVAGQYIRR